MGRPGSRYDEIGRSYTNTRRQDPRIAAQILDAVGSGTVVNLGAGSGNYEPDDRPVVAVEPSPQMIRHRPGGSAPVVRGTAESLPFPDRAFDVAMAVLTIHHWSDPAAGLDEMARVASRQVVFYFEQRVSHRFWALDYFPGARSLPTETASPGEQFLRHHLDVVEVRPVPVPRDCIDGFGLAFWARPEAYLDPEVQAGMSLLAMLSDEERREGSDRLRADLESGAWERRHGHLLHQDTFDGGYRIAIATGRRAHASAPEVARP
ncbi:MAG: class I SAM-dependent methyltransferase [Acidimicrobiia bacterium]|nr:class I SAM-dependent methyltransferase [Acidimicrobiia bacterium]